MKALLICPGEKPSVELLAETAPLALVPLLGKCLVEYWLEHLAQAGAKQVDILADDRPERVRALVGNGSRWGLSVLVLPSQREFSPAEARARFRRGTQWLAEPNDVILADHFPGLPNYPLFSSYAGLMAAMQAWLPRATGSPRIGVREIKPGVWVGLQARIAPDVELRAPCWIGDKVQISGRSVLGPLAIVEDRAVLDRGVCITESLVSSGTFVGALTRLHTSLVCGPRLINWKTNSWVKVPDRFLLSSLGPPEPLYRRPHWAGRVAAAALMSLTLPLALGAIMKSKWQGQPAFRARLGVRPQSPKNSTAPFESMVYFELANVTGWLRRWPQLWSVARGDFTWVGNRPLNPLQAGRLTTDFDRLWLAAPLGLVSLADARGCPEFFGDEARAHAGYYAVKSNWRINAAILLRVIFSRLFGIRFAPNKEELPVSLKTSVQK